MQRFSRWYLGIQAVVLVYFIGMLYAVIELFHDTFHKRKRLCVRNSEFFNRLTAPVAVVTGGNGTIGFEVVKGLLDIGFRVISISRDDIFQNNYEHDHLESFAVDFSDPSSVKKVGSRIAQLYGEVNLLICNAGVMLVRNQRTKCGYEPHITINLLAHVGLIEGIMPALRRAKNPSRIVLVSSSTAFAGNLNCSKGKVFEEYINGYYAYAKSKLALSCYAEQLDKFFLEQAANLNERPVARVCSLHPGCVPGALYNNAFLLARISINYLLAKILRNASTAAAEIIDTALNDDFEGGVYYERMKVVKLRPDVSENTKRKLFELVSESYKGIVKPTIEHFNLPHSGKFSPTKRLELQDLGEQ